MAKQIEARLARLEEQAAPDESDFPDVIELVPVHREEGGNLVEGEPVEIWRREVPEWV